ncbi:hypothetical protein IF2G_06995 [Cordyceps javanica]|nr:hypothetical protein IF2G_06995 [Cordyceps javanica]
MNTGLQAAQDTLHPCGLPVYYQGASKQIMCVKKRAGQGGQGGAIVFGGFGGKGKEERTRAACTNGAFSCSHKRAKAESKCSFSPQEEEAGHEQGKQGKLGPRIPLLFFGRSMHTPPPLWCLSRRALPVLVVFLVVNCDGGWEPCRVGSCDTQSWGLVEGPKCRMNRSTASPPHITSLVSRLVILVLTIQYLRLFCTILACAWVLPLRSNKAVRRQRPGEKSRRRDPWRNQ